MGMKPMAGTRPVMITGRTRSMVPSMIARLSSTPSSSRWRTLLMTTRPLSTATPDRQMKPTAADTENAMPVRPRAKTPPARPSGTAVNTARARPMPPNAM